MGLHPPEETTPALHRDTLAWRPNVPPIAHFFFPVLDGIVLSWQMRLNHVLFKPIARVLSSACALCFAVGSRQKGEQQVRAVGKEKTEGGQGNCSIPKAAAGKGGWTTLLAQGGHDPETPVTHQVHISDGSDCQAPEQTLSGTWSLTSRAGLTNAWQA